jgi:hypothetical protein
MYGVVTLKVAHLYKASELSFNPSVVSKIAQTLEFTVGS